MQIPFGDVAYVVFGSLGIGGAIVAIYFRATIAETIIEKLDKRYVDPKICSERHKALQDNYVRLNSRVDTLDSSVQHGFERLEHRINHLLEGG
jgi:hypothetical protein